MANPSTQTRPAPAAANAGKPAANQQSDQEKRIARQKAKGDRFKKLATKRVNKVLKALDGVGQLSNRNSYAFEAEQISKIFSALSTRFANVQKRFESGAVVADEFTL